MKVHPTPLPFWKNQNTKSSSTLVFLVGITMFFFIICISHLIPLVTYPLCMITRNFSQTSSPPLPSYDVAEVTTSTRARRNKECDIFSGEWVRNPDAPYYTNTTCWAIHDHQNCMKYGRPDTDFMKWRWKPDECELSIFNASQFLELVRGKSLAFVGDSVARNQMQSLICLLSTVEYPVDVSYTTDEKSRRWKYTNYNFTVTNFWSPFLVKSQEADPKDPAKTNLFNLYLDEVDEEWTLKIEEFDYLIISAGHWFFRPSMFYQDNKLVGCHYCLNKNVTDLSMYYSYRKAFRTAFRAINSLNNFNGVTFLRTFAPSHFENGLWNKGGDCVRRQPFRSNEISLEGINLEFYMTQLEEFKVGKRDGMKKGLKYRLMDTTQATLMRPDGYPSRYGHRPEENVTMYNDCVHWCLPGPVDTWNDFLFEMLKMDRRDPPKAKPWTSEQWILIL